MRSLHTDVPLGSERLTAAGPWNWNRRYSESFLCLISYARARVPHSCALTIVPPFWLTSRSTSASTFARCSSGAAVSSRTIRSYVGGSAAMNGLQAAADYSNEVLAQG